MDLQRPGLLSRASQCNSFVRAKTKNAPKTADERRSGAFRGAVESRPGGTIKAMNSTCNTSENRPSTALCGVFLDVGIPSSVVNCTHCCTQSTETRSWPACHFGVERTEPLQTASPPSNSASLIRAHASLFPPISVSIPQSGAMEKSRAPTAKRRKLTRSCVGSNLQLRTPLQDFRRVRCNSRPPARSPPSLPLPSRHRGRGPTGPVHVPNGPRPHPARPQDHVALQRDPPDVGTGRLP